MLHIWHLKRVISLRIQSPMSTELEQTWGLNVIYFLQKVAVVCEMWTEVDELLSINQTFREVEGVISSISGRFGIYNIM